MNRPSARAVRNLRGAVIFNHAGAGAGAGRSGRTAAIAPRRKRAERQTTAALALGDQRNAKHLFCFYRRWFYTYIILITCGLRSFAVP